MLEAGKFRAPEIAQDTDVLMAGQGTHRHQWCKTQYPIPCSLSQPVPPLELAWSQCPLAEVKLNDLSIRGVAVLPF